MDGHEPQQRVDQLNQPFASSHMHSSPREPLSDMRSSEILISAGDSGRARSTSTSIVEEYARDPDGASTAPLLRKSHSFLCYRMVYFLLLKASFKIALPYPYRYDG